MSTPDDQAKAIKDILLGEEFQSLMATRISTQVSEHLKQPLEKIIQLEERSANLEEKTTKLEKESATQKSRIDQLVSQLDGYKKTVSTLKTSVNNNDHRVKTQSFMTDSGKSKNLVITGIPEDGKSTKDAVKIIMEKIAGPINDNAFTVDRLGKPNESNAAGATGFSLFGRSENNQDHSKKSRPVLIKFQNNWERRKVYASRMQLRGMGEDGKNVFINEDLTKDAANLYYHARQARKQRKFKSCWTEGGLINIKMNNDIVKVISSLNELAHLDENNPSSSNSDSSFHSFHGFPTDST